MREKNKEEGVEAFSRIISIDDSTDRGKPRHDLTFWALVNHSFARMTKEVFGLLRC